MKQMEVTEKTIGQNTFYIRPFPAFVAVNISGELASVLTPILGGLASIVGGNAENGNILDTDIDQALPAITQAFSGISGDKFERLMKKLLIDNKNISVEGEATDGDTKLLTMDLANEVFCGEIQDMYILCFEVIKINFKGFFEKIGAQFGSLKTQAQTMAPGLVSMAN